jgi:hypothetical protein
MQIAQLFEIDHVFPDAACVLWFTVDYMLVIQRHVDSTLIVFC